MADENTDQDSSQQKSQLSSSAQNVVDKFALEAQRARDLLHFFQQDKTIVRIKADSGTTETKSKIIDFAFTDPDGEEDPDDLEGYTLNDLTSLIRRLDTYIQYSDARRDFAKDKPSAWTQRQLEFRFGANPKYAASLSEVNEAIDKAIALMNYIIGYSSDEVKALLTPAKAAPTEAATPDSTPGFTGNIPIPTSLLAGEAVTKPDDEKKTEEEKKKEKEEEEQRVKSEKPRNFIQEITNGNASFHKEVVRMEVMLANQLAAFYGIGEKDVPAFTQEFTQYIAPHLFFELQKLSPSALQEALKSSKGRSNIYLSALLRMQHDPVFRARLTLYLQTPAVKKNRKKDAQPTDEEIAQTKQPDAKDIAAIIARNEEGQEYLSTEDIKNIGEVRSASSSTLASELREILGIRGAGLAESDINNILVRLQTFAVTRKNINNLTPEQYQLVFGSVFGAQNSLVFDRIRLYFQTSKLEWTRLFSAYVESTRMEIYNKTQNPAVLFLDKDGQPSDAVIDHTYQKMWSFGNAVATSLYTPGKVLEKRKEELEASGPAGKEGHEYVEVTDALALKQENVNALQRFVRLTPLQQQHVYVSLGYTSAVYQQMHIQEVVNFIQSFQIEGGSAEGTLQEIGFLDFIYPQQFLTASTEGGVYNPDTPAAQQWLQFAQAKEGKGNGNFKVGGIDVDRTLGKAALALMTSGASIPIIEKIEKVQGFIAMIPGGDKLNELMDKYGWKSLDMMGKAIRWVLSLAAVKLLLDLLSLVAAVLAGIKLAAALSSLFQSGAAGLVAGAQALLGKVGAGIAKFASGVGSALSGLTASGIGLLKALSVASPFAAGVGGLFGAGAIVIMGYTIFFSDSVSPAFLTNVDGGASATGTYADGIGNRGCWPTSGHVNGLDKYAPRLCTPSIFNNYCSHGTTSQCVTGLSGQPVCGVGPGGRGQAIDIGAAAGSPVYAPYEGKATFYGTTSGICYTVLGIKFCGYGKHVVMKSNIQGRDIVFIFAHLRDFGNFSEGETDVVVKVGDVIGSVDNTGNSTGDHLHYEVLGTTRDSIIPERVAFDQTVASNCSPTLGDDATEL